MKNKKEESCIICDACKHEFYLNAVKIQESIVKLNNVPVVLIYFTCPKCNKIYRVSIQDKHFYELAADINKIEKWIRKSCDNIQRNHISNSEEVKRMQEHIELLNSMVLKKKQHLVKYEDAVNKKFSGTFTFVTSENNQEEKVIEYLP